LRDYARLLDEIANDEHAAKEVSTFILSSTKTNLRQTKQNKTKQNKTKQNKTKQNNK
jgi:hypothetical protein